MNAEVTWKQGLQLEATSDSHYTITMDSVPGGPGVAPTPMEFVLMSLCGCTAMDVASILQKMRRTITSFSVKANGTRAETHPKKYIAAEVVYSLVSPDVTEEEFTRAIELSEEKYCSVSAMFKDSGAKMSWRMELKRG